MNKRSWRRSLAAFLFICLLAIVAGGTSEGQQASPWIEITAPAAGAEAAGDTPEIRLAFHAAGTLRVDGGKLEVKVDGAIVPCKTSRDLAHCQAPFLFPGEHQIVATAPDSAGGRVEMASSFEVPASLADMDPPLIRLYHPEQLKIYTAEPIKLFFQLEDEGRSGLAETSFALRYDGRPLPGTDCRIEDKWVNCWIPPEPGHHLVAATVADRAGNQGAASFEFEILPLAADREAPQISILGPELESLDGHVFPTSRFFAFIECSDEGSGLDRETLSDAQLDGSEFGGCDNGFGMPSAECSDSLAPGAHTLRVTAADHAGNRSELTASFVIGSAPEPAAEPEDPPEIDLVHPDPLVALAEKGVEFLVIWSHWKYPTEIDSEAVWVKLDGHDWPGTGLVPSERLEDRLPLPVGRHRLSIHVADPQGRRRQIDYDFEV